MLFEKVIIVWEIKEIIQGILAVNSDIMIVYTENVQLWHTAFHQELTPYISSTSTESGKITLFSEILTFFQILKNVEHKHKKYYEK